MPILIDLIAQRAALEEQIKTLTQTQRAGAIEQINAMMRENGLTLADLGGPGKKSIGKPRGGAGKKVAAKYRDSEGNSWSGRGLKPKWLQAAMTAGKKVEDFAV